jgi:hypothetical protein
VGTTTYNATNVEGGELHYCEQRAKLAAAKIRESDLDADIEATRLDAEAE